MSAAFDRVDIGRTELVQRAIHGIRNPRRQARLQRKFEANPSKVCDRLVNRLAECDSDECDTLSDFLDAGAVQAIDPETLKRWIEIVKILLPLILAFL
jgi:hypothetical protein